MQIKIPHTGNTESLDYNVDRCTDTEKKYTDFFLLFFEGSLVRWGGPLASDAIFNIVLGAIFLIIIFLGAGKRPGYPALPRVQFVKLKMSIINMAEFFFMIILT